MIVMGIDPSITCTGICISDGHKHIYNIITSKNTKKLRNFAHNRVHITIYNKLETKGLSNEMRETSKTDNIYNIICAINALIDAHHPDLVVMEGVAFNATGTVADLAGLNYIIRYILKTRNIPFIIATPTTIKKFAVGNGGADKDLMVYAWEQLEPDLKDIKEIKVDDIADAFFMAQYGLQYPSVK